MKTQCRLCGRPCARISRRAESVSSRGVPAMLRMKKTSDAERVSARRRTCRRRQERVASGGPCRVRTRPTTTTSRYVVKQTWSEALCPFPGVKTLGPYTNPLAPSDVQPINSFTPRQNNPGEPDRRTPTAIQERPLPAGALSSFPGKADGDLYPSWARLGGPSVGAAREILPFCRYIRKVRPRSCAPPIFRIVPPTEAFVTIRCRTCRTRGCCI